MNKFSGIWGLWLLIMYTARFLIWNFNHFFQYSFFSWPQSNAFPISNVNLSWDGLQLKLSTTCLHSVKHDNKYWRDRLLEDPYIFGKFLMLFYVIGGVVSSYSSKSVYNRNKKYCLPSPLDLKHFLRSWTSVAWRKFGLFGLLTEELLAF